MTKPTVRAAMACPMVAASSCAVTNMLGMRRLSRIVRSLLGQIDFATSLRTTSALVTVILLGGIVASIAFTVVELRPELPWLFLILLAVGLAFGGRAAADVRAGKVYAGVLVTFLILFGLGVSPLPGSSAEAFSTRVGYVLAAVLYTLVMAGLLWSRRDKRFSTFHQRN